MANSDKQFTITGTGSLVGTDFGVWTDSQIVRVSGAAAEISWDGTNTISLEAGQGLEYADHRRSKIYVSGAGATVTVIVSASSELS